MKRRKDGFSGERSIVLPQMIVEMEEQDPLVSSLFVTDIGYYPQAAHHYRERTDAISQHVLIYCVAGAGWYRADGRVWPVHANQYFILPAGKAHAYGADESDPWTIYWVHFSGAHSDIYAQGAQRPQDVRPNVNSRISDRNHIFEEIFNTLYRGYSRENLRYVSSLLHYYLASMRYIQQFRLADESSCKLDDSTVVSAAIHYMTEHIERKLSLQDMADYTGYSPSHFSSLFRQQTGHSPLHYFNQLKIQRACDMLATTDIKINQLCYKVGIDDSYYFSRLFTKLMGMSPTSYRENKNHT